MTALTIIDFDTKDVIEVTDDRTRITEKLTHFGITFRHLPDDRLPDFIFEDFPVHDRIDLVESEHEFAKEHIHSDVELRLITDGGGTFFVHLGSLVAKLEVEKHDLIVLPARIPHWFKVEPYKRTIAFRGFSAAGGWEATFTGADYSKEF